MSTISSQHNISKYVAGSSKPFDGQRLAKIIFRKASGKESQCASVPAVAVSSINSSMQALMPHVVAMVQDAQDRIIRDLVLAGRSSIADSELSMEAVLQQLAREAESGRLSKDDAIAWFDDTLADMLSVAIADKLGVSDTPSQVQTMQIAAQVDVYREKLCSLAGGKTSYAPELALGLLRALEFAPAQDEIAARFQKRLTKMATATPVGLVL